MSKKKAWAIIIGVLAVFVLAAVYLFFSSFYIMDGQSVASVKLDTAVGLVNDMREELSGKMSGDDYEKLLTACKDWEEKSNGEIYRYNSSKNFDLSDDSFTTIYRDMYQLGFDEVISIFTNYDEEGEYFVREVGVKLVKGKVTPKKDNGYYETAEYGLCYMYDDSPDDLVIYGINNDISCSYFRYYLEEVHDGLYAYLLYTSNYPLDYGNML